MPRDVYYGLYAAAVVGLLAAWSRSSDVSMLRLLARRWPWGVGLGLVFAVVMAFTVLRAEDATVHPTGLRFAAAIFWRGVVYGATDGLLLSVFPILAVFALFAGTALRRRPAGKVAIGAAALAVSLVFTAVCHLGYPDFRSGKVAKPVAGDAIWSVPTLVTLSPLGAPLAHIGLHVTAVVHSYDTDVFLPPHTESGSPDS